MIFSQLEQQLGAMTWPLLICSFVTSVILLDRVWRLLLISRLQRHALHQQLALNRPVEESTLQALSGNYRRSLLWQGIYLLINHRRTGKALREEIAGLWLQQQRKQLTHGIKILSLMGAVSPLLGLLGTILGLIQMFQDLSTSIQPVTPALLANGLGIAMYTTAAGLFIALPALIGAHLLTAWVDRIMHTTELEMNHYNLWLDGITLHGESMA